MTTPWRSVKTIWIRLPPVRPSGKKRRRDVEGGGSLPNARLCAARLATSGPRLQGGGVTGVRHQIPPIFIRRRRIAIYSSPRIQNSEVADPPLEKSRRPKRALDDRRPDGMRF